MTIHIKLIGQTQRDYATTWLKSLPDNWVVTAKPPSRSGDQNAKMWSMIADIKKQTDLPYDGEQWKCLLMDECARETDDPAYKVSLLPALSGGGYVAMSHKSSRLSVGQMAVLIEAIYRYGAQYAIRWSHFDDERIS